jgi:hypothetical protein
MMRLDDYTGLAFEEIARGYARYLIAAGDLPGDWYRRGGRTTGSTKSISSARPPTFIGSAKWRGEPWVRPC